MQGRLGKEVILSTKLQPPQIKKNTLYRHRLLQLLDKNLDRKLILINAGAGYGKTTLLTQALSKTEIPYIFYRLENTDSELVVFFSYMTAALKKIFPKFGKRTNNILKTIEYPDRYFRMLVGTFINELVENTSRDLFIVLDDYHNIDPAGQIDQALDYLFSHAPPFLHFYILTRKTPNFHLIQMKMRNDIYELSTQDIKFTDDEIMELFENIHQCRLPKDEFNKIKEYSEGWITSLQLILQFPRGNIKDIAKQQYLFSNKEDNHKWQLDIFDYFAQEIYNQESGDIQQFMVDCSLLEWLNKDICYTLTNRYNSGKILRNLEARNAFLFRMHGNNYRFHNLFRDFLFSKLADSKRKEKLFLKAANYLYKIHQEYAINYYLEARHYNRAINIIKKIGYDLVNEGKSNTVCSFIEKLPGSLVNQNSGVLAVHSYALMLKGFVNEAYAKIQRAIRIIQRKKKLSLTLAEACYTLASINFIRGNDRLAKKWLIKALEACSNKRDIVYARILNALGVLYSRMGVKKYADAVTCFKKALKITERFPKGRIFGSSVLNNWAMAERKVGNLHAAYGKSLSAINLLKKKEVLCAQSGWTFTNAAMLCLDLGEIKRVHSILKLGEEISKKYNDIYSLANLWKGYANYYEELGELDQSEEYLKKAMNFFTERKQNRMIRLINCDFCSINIALGFFTEAEQNISTAWETKRNKDDADSILILLAEAKLRMAQGKVDIAEKILSQCLKLAKKYGQSFGLFQTLIELTKVLYRKSMITAATEMLRQAVKLSCEKGYEYLLSKEIKKEKWMMELSINIDKDYILSILNQFKIPYHSVEIFLFDSPQVFVDGKKIKQELWKTAKAMKLFCYLCINKERTPPRDILINTLWRDFSLRSGSKSLRKAMHHIRQVFQSITTGKDNPIIYKKKKYYISENFSIWIDTEEFMNLVDEGKKLQHSHKKLKDNIKKAISLYKDGLAKGWYDEWIEDMRPHYKKLYEESLLKLADNCLKNGDYADSAFWFKKLIQINFYAEEYHKKMWTAYAKLKKYKEIKEDFVKLKKTFKNKLKTKLKPETIKLYKSYIH